MRLIRLIVSTPLADLLLIARAALTMMSCQARLHLASFDSVQCWARAQARRPVSKPRLVWAANAAARLGAWSCLVQALALQRMLSRHGEASELCIGVKKQGDELVAHAWLVIDEQILIGGETGDYRLLTRFNAVDDAAAASGRT